MLFKNGSQVQAEAHGEVDYSACFSDVSPMFLFCAEIGDSNLVIDSRDPIYALND
ncbi:hypothetical protein [Cupriavidus pampae]|uniref:Uncharacterized protein n=1 Tax=Cupriavidus pampae TaxID=659251 RepID=A0ABM8WAK2_9BURK|nr:hypothetical protein [Cupriavidus pampae]CAG9164286.1 hypothetical protein LMG32289_00628 [Cupriavidus pampae]